MQALSTVTSLPDDALLVRVGVLVDRERHATAALIAALGEVDARKLYLGAGCSSLFTYCTHVLHLSENAAYDRIAAARCARRYPHLLELLAEGAVTLTAVCLLIPVMTAENANDLLNRARHKSKGAVERLVAQIRPQPAVSTSVRKLPIPRSATLSDSAVVAEDKASSNTETSSAEPAPDSIRLDTHTQSAGRRPVVKPLAPDIYKVQFTLSSAGYKQLRRAQDLLRHSIPNGDAGVILERALGLLVEQLEKKKLAAAKRPRLSDESPKKGSRHIPAAVTREVWRRDEGRCAFVGTHGRCAERGHLELHHVIPFADGGAATVANIQLRCRSHNQHEADLWCGADVVKNRPPGYAST
jgi:hypothetical protein